MKFLPENRKKTLLALLALIVSLGGTVYLNFFYGKAPDALPLIPANIFSGDLGEISIPGSGPVADSQPSALLPYGSAIDTNVLEQEAFKALRSAPRVQVLPSELGKTNPFSR